eukprot:jgi/Botrbrau1/1188/Bobra.0163s0002.1
MDVHIDAHPNHVFGSIRSGTFLGFCKAAPGVVVSSSKHSIHDTVCDFSGTHSRLPSLRCLRLWGYRSHNFTGVSCGLTSYSGPRSMEMIVLGVIQLPQGLCERRTP